MNWNDYEAIWKRQPLPIGAGADLAQLHATYEAKRRKMAATLLVRDLTEAGAGLLGAAAFGFIWWKTGPAAWPMGLAIGLILGVTGFFVRERFRARRLRVGDDAPLLVRIEADLAELRHQHRLLRTIWRWYLGPISTAVLICHFTLYFQKPEPQRDPVIGAGFVMFYALCFWFAWWLNHQAARKQLEPRLAELEKLHQDLLAIP